MSVMLQLENQKGEVGIWKRKNEYLSIRIEPDLKEKFYEFCEKSGISVSAAINQLAIKSMENGSIPFTIHVIDYDI